MWGGGAVAHFEDFDVWMSSDWHTELGPAVSSRCGGSKTSLKGTDFGVKNGNIAPENTFK